MLQFIRRLLEFRHDQINTERLRTVAARAALGMGLVTSFAGGSESAKASSRNQR